jgi:hypothetical protein
MKRAILTTSALLMVILGTMASANALDVQLGPGGVYVGPHRHFYNYYGNCHLVITHRVNRWDENVTVRRRICD